MSESFLHQVIQDSIPLNTFVSVSTISLKATLKAWVELLLEYQRPATIWLKLPSNLLQKIEPYLKQEYVEKVYICGEPQHFSSLSITQKKNVWFNVGNSAALSKESFLLVKSIGFSGLLFASEKNLDEFELTYSFDVSLCENFLKRLEDAITITDNTSLEVLVNSSITAKNWEKTEISLITSLLLKQTKAFEEIENQNDSNLFRENAIEELQQSLKVQENFLRQLSEQMQLPLTNMKTAISLLQSPTLKIQQRQRYVEILQQQWKRQYALWSALLEWVQIEEIFSNPGSALSICELELVLFNIVSLYQSMAQEKEITLTYSLPAGLPKIQCPEFCLQRILSHILDNSLKFTKPGGKVSISCSLVDNSFELIIKDTGCGIRNNELGKIFDSFYRGHNAINDPASVGLGLTIVKLLLQNCKGSVKVKSQLNEGCSFKVILPAAAY